MHIVWHMRPGKMIYFVRRFIEWKELELIWFVGSSGRHPSVTPNHTMLEACLHLTPRIHGD